MSKKGSGDAGGKATPEMLLQIPWLVGQVNHGKTACEAGHLPHWAVVQIGQPSPCCNWEAVSWAHLVTCSTGLLLTNATEQQQQGCEKTGEKSCRLSSWKVSRFANDRRQISRSGELHAPSHLDLLPLLSISSFLTPSLLAVVYWSYTTPVLPYCLNNTANLNTKTYI